MWEPAWPSASRTTATSGIRELDTGIGFDAWGGYRFARHFAAELEIQYVDRLNLGPINGNALAFTGNLKGYL